MFWIGLGITLCGWYIGRGLDSAGRDMRKGLESLASALNNFEE
jgi:hypothetical protein